MNVTQAVAATQASMDAIVARHPFETHLAEARASWGRALDRVAAVDGSREISPLAARAVEELVSAAPADGLGADWIDLLPRNVLAMVATDTTEE